MNKKIIFGIIAIVLIVSAVFGIKQLITPEVEGNEYFTLEPESWIEEIDYTAKPADVQIDLFKATRGNAMMVDNIQEDYNLNGKLYSFFYRGSYKGSPFKTVYIIDEFYNKYIGQPVEEQEKHAVENTLMKISPEIDPTDGVINGFILAKQENGKFVFYMFVDEDWKQKLNYTSILWGDNFANPNSLHTRPFNFQNSINGIYIDKLEEDIDWFESMPIEGGIAVGEIDQGVLNKVLNEQEINETFMYVR